MCPNKETVIRTVITFITLLNSILVMCGKNPVPYGETQLYTALSCIISVVSTLWAWWKNNSFTVSARMADEYMQKLKGRG